MLAKVAAASIWIDRPLEQTTVRLTAERHPKISEGYFHRGPLKRMFFTKSNGNHHRHTHTPLQYHHVIHGMIWYAIWPNLTMSWVAQLRKSWRHGEWLSSCTSHLQQADASGKERPKGDPRNKTGLLTTNNRRTIFKTFYKTLKVVNIGWHWLRYVKIGYNML